MKHQECENIEDFIEKGHSHAGREAAEGEFPSGLSLLEMSEDVGEEQQLVIQEMEEFEEEKELLWCYVDIALCKDT